ncbi:hypothetical protein BDV29DRAFT_89637 [Aspergillus leporis]|uniref:Uncharacterized protein n=1 Tax=Aspergillus leporis TaxID=41062 RepID=A0A5N5XAE5_9EURO|nr:hypothetical protein BDV29DRAFT_89637 [Aspergillus leporis]
MWFMSFSFFFFLPIYYPLHFSCKLSVLYRLKEESAFPLQYFRCPYRFSYALLQSGSIRDYCIIDMYTGYCDRGWVSCLTLGATLCNIAQREGKS